MVTSLLAHCSAIGCGAAGRKSKQKGGQKSWTEDGGVIRDPICEALLKWEEKAGAIKAALMASIQITERFHPASVGLFRFMVGSPSSQTRDRPHHPLPLLCLVDDLRNAGHCKGQPPALGSPFGHLWGQWILGWASTPGWFGSVIEPMAWVISQPVGKSCSTLRGTPISAHGSFYTLHKILDSIESHIHIYRCVCICYVWLFYGYVHMVK